MIDKVLTEAELKSGMIQSAETYDAVVELSWDKDTERFEIHADNTETNDMYARAKLSDAQVVYKAMLNKYIKPIITPNL